MSNDATVTREFGGFERLELRDRTNWVDLIIEPGEGEALVIEGPLEILTRIKTEVQAGTLKIALGGNLVQKVQGALTTSLSRKKVRYHLTARDSLRSRCSAWSMSTSVPSEKRGLRSSTPDQYHPTFQCLLLINRAY